MGLAPRIGMAWSPKMFNDKIVVRAGWGLYYDRGELFSLSLARLCFGRDHGRSVSA